MWGIELAVMAAMIAVNSVFAGYEIALASVSLARLQQLASENRGGSKVALYMKQNMEASLAVVQLGITLVGAIAAAIGGAGAEETLAPRLVESLGVSENAAEILGIALVVLPLTVVTIIVGELIPKVFALRNAEWVCLTLSPYMRWFSIAVWPAVWLFEGIVMGVMSWGERRLGPGQARKPETAELQELRASAAVARATRLIGHREERIILGATELPSRPVRDIMLPAEHMCTLSADTSLAENLVAAHLDMHTRFPVVERPGDPQSVIGYVNVKDIISTLHLNPHDPSLRGIVRPLLVLQADVPIAQGLDRLMQDHTHIALVRDAERRVVGMITLEDIIEELVGEIEDEYDKLPLHIVGSGPAWIVGGGATLRRIHEVTGINLAPGEPAVGAQSLSTWLESSLGREVRGGDLVETDAARVLVRKIRRKKALEVQIGPGTTRAGGA